VSGTGGSKGDKVFIFVLAATIGDNLRWWHYVVQLALVIPMPTGDAASEVIRTLAQ